VFHVPASCLRNSSRVFELMSKRCLCISRDWPVPTKVVNLIQAKLNDILIAMYFWILLGQLAASSSFGRYWSNSVFSFKTFVDDRIEIVIELDSII
jgi:hypothetical protein